MSEHEAGGASLFGRAEAAKIEEFAVPFLDRSLENLAQVLQDTVETYHGISAKLLIRNAAKFDQTKLQLGAMAEILTAQP